jgi:hypothetical protein
MTLPNRPVDVAPVDVARIYPGTAEVSTASNDDTLAR